MTAAPCPVCDAPYGFHDDEPHAAATARIPRHLILPTSTAQRDERRSKSRAAYAAYLATQPRPGGVA